MSLRGRLLVASPRLGDPNFARTVVLLLEHGDEGAVGVVLNRPSEMGVDQPLPAWAPLAAPPAVVFLGGPVQRSAAICVGRSVVPTARPGWQPVVADLGTLDLGRDPADISGVDAVRVFAGYAGWGSGQLEAELDEGSWVVCEALEDDVLAAEPLHLWVEVLERQGGLVALLSSCPMEPELN